MAEIWMDVRRSRLLVTSGLDAGSDESEMKKSQQFVPKWQLTAAKRGSDLKFDSKTRLVHMKEELMPQRIAVNSVWY